MPFSEPQKQPFANTATLCPAGQGPFILLPRTAWRSETRIGACGDQEAAILKTVCVREVVCDQPAAAYNRRGHAPAWVCNSAW